MKNEKADETERKRQKWLKQNQVAEEYSHKA